jgi:hypothetical protein
MWKKFVFPLLIMCCARSAIADEESAALAKYKQPIDIAVDRALAQLSKTQRDDGLFGGQYGSTMSIERLMLSP